MSSRTHTIPGFLTMTGLTRPETVHRKYNRTILLLRKDKHIDPRRLPLGPAEEIEVAPACSMGKLDQILLSCLHRLFR